MEFRLAISLGNAAMLTPADIADALRNIADNIGEGYEPAVATYSPHQIRDTNGNRVGAWEVSE
ncbi:uncharacterized protein with von Willebrand factor type A (vWA) domain [Microbacterium testaceum]|uniref:hypothetical protein n=1 Tax=Microbacterium TaxID=33882 RepID=UPI00278879B9|nr:MULTISPECIES: hypothetical protein [Microbacterium]MDQ1113947.1 uncharacterized protein with von Willebrand factor type A (vWA) domain [Microbacterium testaceum]MDR6098946.1 uncharacterized protein with von Willebrand factor type A (vWA) domain [Microbacterium sp. SORGH_AS_0454]